MKSYELIPAIVGGIAGGSLYKLGTEDPGAMSFMGFAIAFLICCRNGQAVTLRAVISGILAAPAGLFCIGLLHMDLTPEGWVVLGACVYVFSAASYYVGKKCKPKFISATKGQ